MKMTIMDPNPALELYEIVRKQRVEPFIKKANSIFDDYLLGNINKNNAEKRLIAVFRDADRAACGCGPNIREEVDSYSFITFKERYIAQEYTNDVIQKIYDIDEINKEK